MHTLQKSSMCGASGAPPLTMNRTLRRVHSRDSMM